VSEPPGRPRLGLGLALAAVALSFVPFLGVGVAAAALLRAGRDRRRGLVGGGALGIAVLGALLSSGYTAGYVACAPSGESPTQLRTWREFDRLFTPASPQGPGNVQGNPASPAPGP
jgi:hypothetical protein